VDNYGQSIAIILLDDDDDDDDVSVMYKTCTGQLTIDTTNMENGGI
jgi:hypothetical protein